jgi:glucosamine--fructose-6-phosphate aminotransferase (isomerizing)
MLDAAGRAVRIVDAAEALERARADAGAAARGAWLVLSRSGRSIEVVKLVAKLKAAGAGVIGVTNDPASPLAQESSIPIGLGAAFDHNVSVTMYSGVALAGALIAALAVGAWRDEQAREIERALDDAERRLPAWRERIAASGWCVREATTVLLARGPGLAAALEARQLWEEAAKHPATALSTGAFRHGPNEVVRPGCRVVLWLAADERLRAVDLELARDLRRAGAKVALIGPRLPGDAADLELELPGIAAPWRFLVELMPVRLLPEAIARLRGVDCDRFDYCPFVVESESGLGPGHGGS